MSRSTGGDVSISAIGETGEEWALRQGAPVTVFRGDCCESAPLHRISFRVNDSPARAPEVMSGANLTLEIISLHGGELRRWQVVVPVGRAQ